MRSRSAKRAWGHVCERLWICESARRSRGVREALAIASVSATCVCVGLASLWSPPDGSHDVRPDRIGEGRELPEEEGGSFQGKRSEASR